MGFFCRKKGEPIVKKLLVSAILILSLVAVPLTSAASASEHSTVIQKQSPLPDISKVANEKISIKNKSISLTVKNYEEYKRAMYQLYTDLPQTMKIKSTLSKNRMTEFSDKFEDELIANDLPNYNLLAYYKMKKVGNIYTFTDNSHKKFSAKQIETYINTFATRFADSISELSPNEKLNTIYNYVYSNFKYNANGYQYMMVGNAYTYEMACNGFSRLMYEMLNAAGIETRIIEGEDHYYNLVASHNVFEEGDSEFDFQDDDWFILDVTTDILLNTYHGATGKTTNDYLAYVQKTNIYMAKPIAKETNKKIMLNDKLTTMLLGANNPLFNK